MSALTPFFQAVYDRLQGSAALATYQHASMQHIGVPVFDRVPTAEDPLVVAGEVQEPTTPYVALGSLNETRFPLLAGGAFEGTVQVHVWDDYGGRARVLEVLSLADTALTSTALVVSGYDPLRMRLDFAQVVRDPSGWMHGIWQGRKVNL